MSHFWSCGHELPKKIPNSSTDFNSYNLGVHFFSYSTPKPKQCTTNCKASHFAGHFMKMGGSFQVKTLNHRLLGKYHLNGNTKNDRILVFCIGILDLFDSNFTSHLKEPSYIHGAGGTPEAQTAQEELLWQKAHILNRKTWEKNHVEKKHTYIIYIYIFFFFPMDR